MIKFSINNAKYCVVDVEKFKQKPSNVVLFSTKWRDIILFFNYFTTFIYMFCCYYSKHFNKIIPNL